MIKTKDIIIEELERIRLGNPSGLLQPEAVVEAAKPIDSPLHSKFDWDDSTASYQWRLHQARMLIRVLVTVEERTNTGDTRVFVSLSSDRNAGGGYRTLVDVMKNADQRAVLLQDAKKDMVLFKVKYALLKELGRVFEAMDEQLGQ